MNFTATTPNQIAYVRLASIKGRLKLMRKGLTFRGPAIRPILAEEFGLKPRDSFELYIAEAERRMTVLLEKESAALNFNEES